MRVRRTNDQMQEGQGVNMPISVLRSVSLSRLSEQSSSRQASIESARRQEQANEEYTNIIKEKLAPKINPNYRHLQQKIETYKKVEIKVYNKPNKSNLIEIRNKLEQQQMMQCTFKPRINKNNNNETIKNPQKFYESQIQHVNRKNYKIEEMRQLIRVNKDKQNTFKPVITKNNENLPGNNGNVHQRLFEQSKQRDKCSEVVTETKQSVKGISRTGSVSSIRKKNIPNNDNKDNKQQHCTNNQAILNKYAERMNQFNRTTITNIVSSKGKKSIPKMVNVLRNQEICVVLGKTNISSELSYLELELFLEKINFINSQCTSNDENKLVNELWQMLQGNNFGTISILSLIKIICAVMGYHNVAIIQKYLQSNEMKYYLQKNTNLQNISHNPTRILILNEIESKNIKHQFNLFSLNRLQMGDSIEKNNNIGPNYSFQPQISKISTELANRYRKKVIQDSQKLIQDNQIEFNVPQDGIIDHYDLLLLDDKRKQVKMKVKRQENQKQKQKNQANHRINVNNTDNSINSKNKSIYSQRYNELYELGKQQQNSKRDKSTDQVTLEKWQQQLTFKPKVNRTDRIDSNRMQNIPNFDKSVFRMFEARKGRSTHSYRQQCKFRADMSPLLYLNVSMQGNEDVRVPIFSNDNMGSIKAKICTLMGLAEANNRQLLQQIIHTQVIPVLQKMNILTARDK